MDKIANIDDLISNAVHRTQLQMATNPGMSPIGQFGSMFGIDPSKVDPYTKKYQENRGLVDSIADHGTAKWTGMLTHAPAVLAAFGGTWLLKNMYDSWKNKQVAGELMKDPDIQGMDQARVANAMKEIHRYSPSLMRDPITTKALVKRMVAYDDVTTNDIKLLLETEKLYREAHGLGSYFGPAADVVKGVIG